MAKDDLQKVEEEYKDQKAGGKEDNGAGHGATGKGTKSTSHKSSKKSKGAHSAGK